MQCSILEHTIATGDASMTAATVSFACRSICSSRRSQLEQMERHAKETVAAVIDASPVAIVCSNIEHCIVLWSRAAEQTFGYTAEEAIGHRVKIVPPEFKEQS